MGAGQKDIEKRDRIREIATKNFPNEIPVGQWWAFRISVKKSGNRVFDIENVPKIIIDSFSGKQIAADESNFKKITLYEDDSIDYVQLIQVNGKRTLDDNSMHVEIFHRHQE